MNHKPTKTRATLLLWTVMSVFLTACADKEAEADRAEVEKQATAQVGQLASGPPRQNFGRVKSVSMAAGYSYIEVDVDGEVFWLATAMSAVKPGDEIAWKDYAIMSNFKSKGLNREFDQILFVDRVFAKAALTQQTHTGKVIEAMNSAGYTYIQVNENGKRVWLAVPQRSVEAGQLISWSSTQPMRNFNSPSLNRTFDEIYFVNGVSLS